MQKSPLWADEKLNSPLTSENLPRKRKTLRILNISGKNFLQAGERDKTSATFGKSSLKKENALHLKYFIEEFPVGGRKNHPFSSKLESWGGFYNSSVWKAV